MAELGKFFVTIGSKFDKKGLDKARAAISGVAVAGAAMGAALVAAGLKAAQVAGIQERAEVNLAQAMKTAGTFTEEALKHNLEYASSLQKITIFGDETILSVQKLLTNYGAQGEQLDELTKSTLDFATATGMSLEGAAALVGKTIGSTTNALTRYGIAVDGAVGSNERMQSAVEGITRLFGGAAQANAKTYLGRIQQLNNRWGDFIEKIGFQVIPVILELVTAIEKSLLPIMENWIEQLDESGDGVMVLKTSLIGLTAPLLGIVAAIDIAIAGLKLLAPQFDAALLAKEKLEEKVMSYGNLFNALFEMGKKNVIDTQDDENAKTSIIGKGTGDRAAIDEAASAKAAIELKKREAAFRAFSDSLASSWAGSMATFILEGGKASIAIKNIWDDIRRFIVNMISQIIAKWITLQILTGGQAGAFLPFAQKALGFQAGVKNFEGGLAMVGEAGPELVNLPKGSDVISAPETSRIMNSQKTVIVNNDLSGAVFTEGRIEETLEQITKAVKDGVFPANDMVKAVSRRSSEISEEA